MKALSPLLGFGLDAQYADCYPREMHGLCAHYHERLTHISIVGLTNQADAKQFKNQVALNLPVIHHLWGVGPADPHGPNLDQFSKLNEISEVLGAVWCCEDIGIWSIGPYGIPYFAPPLFEIDVADLVAKRIAKLKELSSVHFLAEVPSCSFIVGNLSLGEFFNKLVEQSGCRLVLDVSHIFSYGLVSGKSPIEILYSLPVDAVWEIHIAGGRINSLYPHRYIDSHSDPILTEVEYLLSESVRACKNLKCVTYEIGATLTEDMIESEVRRIEQTLMIAEFIPKVSDMLNYRDGIC
ncbi:DUF692 family multinuclear iron-containing protein [Nostoc sphaeroides]|uniref:DUF692 domain-containing protein n=1 Tax=Nostoc sphaeroides CCNUC1 TaxID=2653204 RepID=A0A5P8WIZ5_9NOSO|nr:DUF692 family multinuclear iron-containing protein [Nostoc sphaeroides]QFS52823.1 hypothetical protein GXM_10087 [Nostoc sphaeroides CCNUC1]